MLLAVFRANKKVDPYSPTAPTLIARRFEDDRQMSEAAGRGDARARCSTRRSSPRSAGLIEQRLGRPLEPFDIWYNGFRPRQTAQRGGARRAWSASNTPRPPPIAATCRTCW